MLKTIDNPDVTVNNKAQFEKCGLILDESLQYEEWDLIGDSLKGANKALKWWIGDWLNFGERKYGKKYTQALDETDYEYEYLRDMKWVAGRFKLSNRFDNLGWAFHRVVASVNSEQMRAYWLNYATKHKLSKSDLSKLVRSGKTIEELTSGEFSWIKSEEYTKFEEAWKVVDSFTALLQNADKDVAVANYLLGMIKKKHLLRAERIKVEAVDEIVE